MSVMLIDALNARQGGGQTYLLNLLTRLPEGEPSVIYLLAPPDIGPRVASDRVRLLHPEWPLHNPLLRLLWQRLYLRRHARRLGASLLFFPGGIMAGGTPPGAVRATMFRNVIPFDPVQRRRYGRYGRLRAWLLERAMLGSMLKADLVIFLSEYGRSLIEERAPQGIASAVTIPHGVSPLFRDVSDAPRPDWVPDHPYLLYVSSFEPYKAQLEVVRAFASVVRAWKEPLSLVLVGPSNTAYAERVREEIARLGLGDRVHMPGNQPYAQLPAAHHHSLIGIFASEAENCPNALLEAMAAGRPILCSRRKPMQEFGGDAVWYFDPADVDDLAEQLLRLLREPATRAALGERAARWCRRYDWDETARATWTALHKLQRSTEPRFIVHAPNVHVGGGRELLAALVAALDGKHEYAVVLDERFVQSVRLKNASRVIPVRPTLKDRFQAEWQLQRLAQPGSRVLCFGNLPPLFRLRARVYLYLQNRYLLTGERLQDSPWYAHARLAFERFWLRLRHRNADQIVVQTNAMRALVGRRLRRDAIVAPFQPEVREADAAAADTTATRNAFLYVASGEPHKNHLRLIDAWRQLGEAGLRPPLWLTIDPARYGSLLTQIERLATVHGLDVVNFGSVPRSALHELYAKAGALIYPSLVESYGLPLLEARAAGLPILTGELDYVRDVVDPNETFDPQSALSIARAVKRFLGQPERRLPHADAREFVERIMAEHGS